MKKEWPILLLAVFLLGGLKADDTDSLADAERVARQYLTAFYTGDLETAARLTHPELLAKTKRDFLQKAQAGMLDDSPFGEFVTSMEFGELMQIPSSNLFVKIQELSRASTPPQAIEAMQMAQINVVSSERVSEALVQVLLNVVVPTAKGGREQDSPVYLKKFNDDYRVTVP